MDLHKNHPVDCALPTPPGEVRTQSLAGKVCTAQHYEERQAGQFKSAATTQRNAAGPTPPQGTASQNLTLLNNQEQGGELDKDYRCNAVEESSEAQFQSTVPAVLSKCSEVMLDFHLTLASTCT